MLELTATYTQQKRCDAATATDRQTESNVGTDFKAEEEMSSALHCNSFCRMNYDKINTFLIQL